MKIKSGVRVFGIRPEMVLALGIAEPLFIKAGVEMVVTAVIDGKHSRGSLHYAGAAADLRIRHLPLGGAENIYGDLISALGSDYDVVLEKSHIHIEFQPKVPY